MAFRKHLAFWSVLALIAWPVWITGGTQPAWQGPLPILGAIALIAAFLGVPSEDEGRKRRRGGVLSDPVFYIGIPFMLLLAVQWWNAGRELTLNSDLTKWIYGPPRIASLPSAVTKEDAAEMLRWFFPAWALILCVRNGVRGQRDTRRLLRALLYCGCILGTLSILQYLVAVVWGLTEIPSESYFVVSFGYPNHAGAYFLLMLCVALGLLLSELGKESGKSRARIFALSTCAAVCFLAIQVTLSRAAMLISWGVALVCALHSVFGGWHVLAPVRRFNRALTVVVVAVLGFFVLYGFGRDRIKNEFLDRKRKQPENAAEAAGTLVASAAFGDRALQRETAVKILHDHRWFGAGGWCQRYLAATYAPMEKWSHFASEGKANTHCDPLQFLSEFGIVGAVLMAAAVLVSAMPLFAGRRRQSLGPTMFFCCLGLMAVWAWSFTDLPFRSPAVLYTWLAILSALPAATARR